MERYFNVKDSHTRQISALSFNYAKREVVAGYEDGTIKGFDMDSGNQTQTLIGAHTGMVNCLMYWADSRLMLSAGNDGVIAAWLPSGSCFGRIKLYKAVYSLATNPRKRHLLVGLANSMRIYELEEGEDNKFVKQPAIWEIFDHDDIVKCICCYEGRIYTAGFDGYICVYESTIVTTAKVTQSNNTSSSMRDRAVTAKHSGSQRPKTSAYRSKSRRDRSPSPTRNQAAMTTTSGSFVRAPPLERIDKKKAHDAGILCMSVLRDAEANVWVFTGSFDQSLKVWNRDCKLVHQIVGFVGSVSGICYVMKTRSLWAVGGSAQVSIYEPKSGDNISEYISAASRAGEDQENDSGFSALQLLTSSPEYGCVYASTYDKGIVGWKYQPDGCLTCIRSRYPLEAITFTSKTPILIFTGDQRGSMTKWERMEINQYLYTKEELKVAERERKDKMKRRPAAEIAATAAANNTADGSLSSSTSLSTPGAAAGITNATVGAVDSGRQLTFGDSLSNSAANTPRQGAATAATATAAASKNGKQSRSSEKSIAAHSEKRSITRLIYIEDLDYIVAASEDTFIYIWGFDPDACRALADLQRHAARREQDEAEKTSFKRFLDFLQVSDKETKPVEVPEAVINPDAMGVTNRVAGYSCLAILSEHVDCVTALAVVPHSEGFGTTYLLSGGWDRCICVWNIEQFILTQTEPMGRVENAFQRSGGVMSDGVITSLEYCSKTKQFAYSSSDGNAYIHEFSTTARHMVLAVTLIGHAAEVTCIKWNTVIEKWITSSEDGNIKIWDTDGGCIQTLWNRDPVTTLCMDLINGCIVAGVDKTIRVYEVQEYKLIQTNSGHTDQIRSIIHLPEPRNQYVSCGWDRTLRIWNTVRLSKRSQQLNSNNNNNGNNNDMTTTSSSGAAGGGGGDGDDQQEQQQSDQAVDNNDSKADNKNGGDETVAASSSS